MDSVLSSVKKLLGIFEEDEVFDSDILMHINSTVSILSQIGMENPEGAPFVTSETLWSELIPPKDRRRLELVKSYIYLKVKLLFDPPMSSASSESMNRMISEYEWRISTLVDPGSTE